MPFSHGSRQKLYLNGRDIAAFLHSIEVTRASDTAETSTLGTTDKTYIPGLTDSKLTSEGYFDGAAAAIDEILSSLIGRDVHTAFPNANSNIVLEAASDVTQARVEFVNAGASQTLLVTVTGNLIHVRLATDGGGVVTSTATLVLAALAASGPATALVRGTLAIGNTGAGIVAVLPQVGVIGFNGGVFTHLPQGDGVGRVAYGFRGFQTSYKITGAVGSVQAVSIDAQGNAGYERMNVLHPLQTEASAGTSAMFDMGTPPGPNVQAIAFVQSGNTGLGLVLTISHSSDNITYVPLGATVTLDPLAPGGIRLAYAGAILRYVRVAWSNPAGTSVPFHVAFGRKPLIA